MSSGFGTSGGEGRCHAFWQDLRKCMTEAAQPAVCAPMREDYLECLHHRKEFSRMNDIARERRRLAAEAKAHESGAHREGSSGHH